MRRRGVEHTSAYVSIRQHTPAYVSMHTCGGGGRSTGRLASRGVARREHAGSREKSRRASALSPRAATHLHTTAYVSIRQHTSAEESRRASALSPRCYPPADGRIRQHMSAYVSIRQHTSAYVSRRQHTSAYVSIRQHASAYVSIRQHASAYVSIRQHTSAYVSKRTCGPAYVSIRQHTSASVSIRQQTHMWSGSVRVRQHMSISTANAARQLAAGGG
jgi:hypothetical protein